MGDLAWNPEIIEGFRTIPNKPSDPKQLKYEFRWTYSGKRRTITRNRDRIKHLFDLAKFLAIAVTILWNFFANYCSTFV